MEKKSFKAWLYLLPAILFLGFFLVYPLIDVFIYSFEEGTIPHLRLTTASAGTTTLTSCMIHTFCRLLKIRFCS